MIATNERKRRVRSSIRWERNVSCVSSGVSLIDGRRRAMGRPSDLLEAGQRRLARGLGFGHRLAERRERGGWIAGRDGGGRGGRRGGGRVTACIVELLLDA